MLPKISIITPSFNQGQFIEQTILSVLNQHYPNIEYIIIDGGSTDNTLEIIKKYSNRLKYWVSEKDNGQAHAINKGLTHCTGEIFNWINSDDYLAEGALFKVANQFSNHDFNIVAGAVCNFDAYGNRKKMMNKKLSINEYLKKEINLVYHQPGVWLRMDNMNELGRFKENLHYCFDQEYMMRYLLRYNKVGYLEDVLAYFRLHAESKSVSQAEKFAWDFRCMYKDFWHSQKGLPLEQEAKRKFLDYEWPLLNTTINIGERSRLVNFSIAMKTILHDPGYRLNKKSLGWLKHILLGPKNQITE